MLLSWQTGEGGGGRVTIAPGQTPGWIWPGALSAILPSRGFGWLIAGTQTHIQSSFDSVRGSLQTAAFFELKPWLD